jgi:ribonuclease HI
VGSFTHKGAANRIKPVTTTLPEGPRTVRKAPKHAGGCECKYEGRLPNDGCVEEIIEWPIRRNLTEDQGISGTLKPITIFMNNLAAYAKALVQLTRGDVGFEFPEDYLLPVDKLQFFIPNSVDIRAINHSSKNDVVLAVDSSWMAVGFVLSQPGDDGKGYPSKNESITWNVTEQKYSQAKLELYGLFRALKATRTFLIGVENLVVEVDAKYIMGMIKNQDIQPSATINRWRASILLFDFRLRHVSAKDHAPADGLSRRPRGEGEQAEEEDVEEWIDHVYSFSVECSSPTTTKKQRICRNFKPSDAVGTRIKGRISEDHDHVPRCRAIN